MNKTFLYEYVISVDVINTNMYLFACPYMVPDLSMMKSTERFMCILRFWAYCYLKPVAGGAGYMEVVFLHHTTICTTGTI